MNDRIEELAQCNERILNFFQTGPIQRAAIEEFAELIVQECIDTVLDSSVEYTTRPQVAIEIKEHFGVE
jgi:uncharacterized protein YutE (UPF0331/DUF86 family)